MEWTERNSSEHDNVEEIKSHLVSLGFPEYVLNYITKLRPGALGEGLTFYGPEEALIARNEGKCDLHAKVNVRVKDLE